MSSTENQFQREQGIELKRRLAEPRRRLQVVAGARQVGKTTLVQQVVSEETVPVRYVSADEPTLRGSAWLEQQWEAARLETVAAGGILVVDEVQKVENWSEIVKRLWDEDTRRGRNLKVVLLGSAPLMMARGLTESLAGRFETVHLPHWTFPEMRDAFGYSMEEYLYFGGYPGAAFLKNEPKRWRRYILDSLVETSISRDVLLLTRVDKPVLLRRLFELGCRYSGQMLSYTKMLGQLQDAGNTTTLAHYLDLLTAAGLLRGIPKYAGQTVRQRGSSPKLQVFNTALMTALEGLSPEEVRSDREFYGRLVESAVGSHLVNAAQGGDVELFYWRSGNHEVDFVLRCGRRITAVEVKSGRRRDQLPGMSAFMEAFKPDRSLLVGGDGIPIETFLSEPVANWVEAGSVE
jgi:predicted AAA+ superfamily ATPase